MDQGILWTSFMDVPQDDNRMDGDSFRGCSLAYLFLFRPTTCRTCTSEVGISSLTPPPPFLSVAWSGPRPTHASLRRKLWRGAAQTQRRGERRPSHSYSPLSLSFLPPCRSCLFLLCTQISPLDGFLSLPPFSSSSCAVQQQQEASISSAQLAELDRSRTVLFTTRNSPSLFSTHLSSSATDTSIAICRSRLSAR